MKNLVVGPKYSLLVSEDKSKFFLEASYSVELGATKLNATLGLRYVLQGAYNIDRESLKINDAVLLPKMADKNT
jgi:hypothetical protein